jgi:FtsZ-binding cell division protein ZapB
MTEEKKRINAFVPAPLYEQVMSKGYATITEAITKGFEKLLEEPETNIPESSNSLNDGHLMSLQVEVKELRDHNETLKNELEKAERDKENLQKDKDNLQNNYNNYFLQVQTLINQKAIEAPGAKKPWWRIW